MSRLLQLDFFRDNEEIEILHFIQQYFKIQISNEITKNNLETVREEIINVIKNRTITPIELIMMILYARNKEEEEEIFDVLITILLIKGFKIFDGKFLETLKYSPTLYRDLIASYTMRMMFSKEPFSNQAFNTYGNAIIGQSLLTSSSPEVLSELITGMENNVLNSEYKNYMIGWLKSNILTSKEWNEILKMLGVKSIPNTKFNKFNLSESMFQEKMCNPFANKFCKEYGDNLVCNMINEVEGYCVDEGVPLNTPGVYGIDDEEGNTVYGKIRTLENILITNPKFYPVTPFSNFTRLSRKNLPTPSYPTPSPPEFSPIYNPKMAPDFPKSSKFFNNLNRTCEDTQPPNSFTTLADEKKN